MTKPDLMAELAAVVRLSERATPSPWRVEPAWSERGGSDVSITNREHMGDDWDVCTVHSTEANALFIPAAVNFLRTHHAELEAVVRDAALLDFQERECITVRCEAADDDDVFYDAISYHMAKPTERVIGTGTTPREALIQAMHNSAREG